METLWGLLSIAEQHTYTFPWLCPLENKQIRLFCIWLWGVLFPFMPRGNRRFVCSFGQIRLSTLNHPTPQPPCSAGTLLTCNLMKKSRKMTGGWINNGKKLILIRLLRALQTLTSHIKLEKAGLIDFFLESFHMFSLPALYKASNIWLHMYKSLKRASSVSSSFKTFHSANTFKRAWSQSSLGKRCKAIRSC